MSLAPQDIAYQEAHAFENIGFQLIVPVAIWLVVGVVSLFARLASRRLSNVSLEADDYLIVASTIFAVALSIITFMLPSFGVGRHLVTLSESDLITMGKLSFALEFTYTPCLALAKLSICALYLRIFRQGGRWFLTSMYLVIIWICLWTIGTYLSTFLVCVPVETIWTKDCAPPRTVTITTGVFNVVSDLALLFLPQPIVWRLQMPIRRKLLVSGLLTIGSFATVISIVRIPLTIQSGTSGVADITYGLILTDVLTVLEPLTIIICANLPVTQTLWRHYFGDGVTISSFKSLFRPRHSTEMDSQIELRRKWNTLGDSRTSNKSDAHKMHINELTSGSSTEGILRTDSYIVAQQ